MRGSGLLPPSPRLRRTSRCTRNDEQKRSRGTKCPRLASSSPSESKRAQGTPDAGRTREPCVQRKLRFAHASSDRAAETIRRTLRSGLRLIRGLLLGDRSSWPLVPEVAVSCTLHDGLRTREAD